jgi:manganese transport protein
MNTMLKDKPLSEVHGSVDTTGNTGKLKKILAFFGPAYLISVGYMDPGNREVYPKYINFTLYILAEIDIAAADLAEVLGMAIGLHLLTGIPLLYGVIITVLDTLLLLLLQDWACVKWKVLLFALLQLLVCLFWLK